MAQQMTRRGLLGRILVFAAVPLVPMIGSVDGAALQIVFWGEEVEKNPNGFGVLVRMLGGYDGIFACAVAACTDYTWATEEGCEMVREELKQSLRRHLNDKQRTVEA